MLRAFQQETDQFEIIELLRSNTPKYFDPSEEKGFIEYLDHNSDNYFVYEQDDTILGGGGITYKADDDHSVRIAWDLVHPSQHGQGIGQKLVSYRIDQIRLHKDIRRVIVRTSQLAHPFYEKQGFLLSHTIRDYWAPGFDLYFMEMQL